MPYEIETPSEEDLDGGEYNPYKKTITWQEKIEGINTADEGDREIQISHDIRVKYVGYPGTIRTLVNKAKGKIKLSNNERDIEDSLVTDVLLSGEIIVHHYIKDTGESLFDDEYEEGLVGETYISQEHVMEGYVTVTKPTNETHTFSEELQEVIYEYERLKYDLTVEVIGGVGEITGEEEIYYGEDSTPDNIVITPSEGYVITRIIVNGESYEVTDPEGMILDYFEYVTEDINVQVEFGEKEQEVPITGQNTRLIVIATIIVIISLVLLTKFGLVPKMLKR